MYESTVTAKGQTTLPKDVRDLLGLEPGDRIRYLVTGATVRILRPRKAMSLCGALKHEGTPVSLDAMDAAIRNRASMGDGQ
ncbi:AbrB/MazE/SpoVT family DNA-binding domain-containing protein [Rubrimonas sp.]|uniref:AbrB/MazE/SpoVT family DNA-binding domain-containing protein n=1 Tax=Rubrimonas sp. TaxID=2036015 RepID=UPI002FDE8B7B